MQSSSVFLFHCFENHVVHDLRREELQPQPEARLERHHQLALARVRGGEDLARAFFDGKEPGFVNGALDKLAHVLRADELQREPRPPGGSEPPAGSGPPAQ